MNKWELLHWRMGEGNYREDIPEKWIDGEYKIDIEKLKNMTKTQDWGIFTLSHHACCCCCCLGASVVSDSVRPHRRQLTRLPHPWDSPGKNTGVGCNFLLQCMKVKSQSEVTQSCPTLHDPVDCSLPGSSIHGIFQARVLEWGAIAFSRAFSNHVQKIQTLYSIL